MNRSKRNKFAWMLATVALPVTSAALTGHANAACAPAAPVDNTTVTCIGVTNNQNDPAGYGTRTENGLTINVESGASVTGTRFGVSVDGNGASNTINNLGTISGFDQGVLADVATINNSGVITSSGNCGIEGQTVTVTNTVSGVISGNIGMGIRNATVINLGSITGTQNGIEAVTGEINNSGTISASADNGLAILGSRSANVTNSGLIQATGLSATGLSSLDPLGGKATLNNLASGVLTAGKFGIDAITADVTNAGRIESTAANGVAINATTAATVANLAGGTIKANGTDGKAIQATNSATVSNAGLIQSLGATGNAILAGSVNVINPGTIEAPGNVAIVSLVGDARVKNSGTITGAAAAIGAAGVADV